MRTLKFIVDNKTIRQDPSCDFTGLFLDTDKRVRAEFTFSKEWKGSKKVAAFWSILGVEYPPRMLEDGRSCIIPAEALEKSAFKIQILGKKGPNKIITNKITVTKTGGKR